MTDPTDTYEQGRRGDSYNPGGNGSLEDQYAYQDGQAQAYATCTGRLPSGRGATEA